MGFLKEETDRITADYDNAIYICENCFESVRITTEVRDGLDRIRTNNLIADAIRVVADKDAIVNSLKRARAERLLALQNAFVKDYEELTNKLNTNDNG